MKPLISGLIVMGGLAISNLFGGPSAYLISAKPGSVNYFEGEASLNGRPLEHRMIGKTFLNANDVLGTSHGKAEILLMPGIFLRIGDNSQIRISSLSLIDVQILLLHGEAMIEVDELMKGNNVQVGLQGAEAVIRKPGLYRFMAGQPSSVAVISGKLQVSAAGSELEAGKGREILIGESLRKVRFDSKREDDLYAWSNERSEYEAAASYQSARGASFGQGGLSANAQGWLWNDAFDSWAWLPGGDLAFFTPFGYGFFAPGVVGYAPVCFGRTTGPRWRGPWHGRGKWVPLAINPRQPPATGATPRSPWQNRLASQAASRTFAETGLHSARGYVPIGARMTGSSFAGHLWSRGGSSHAIGGSGGHVSGWANSGGASRGYSSSGGFASGRGGSGGGGGRSFGGAGGGHFGGGGGGGGHAGGGSGGGGGGHSR